LLLVGQFVMASTTNHVESNEEGLKITSLSRTHL